jgi:hypothetical protein
VNHKKPSKQRKISFRSRQKIETVTPQDFPNRPFYAGEKTTPDPLGHKVKQICKASLVERLHSSATEKLKSESQNR